MNLFKEIQANRGNLKGALFVISFRISRWIRMNKYLLFFFFIIPILHVLIFNWILGYDIPLKTEIGKGLVIYHGQGLVINHQTIIGSNCILRHSTTIGNSLDIYGNDRGSPNIGDNCDIGAHVVIIGPVKIGHAVTIGAGTIVTKDIPSNAIAYGLPVQVKSKN